MEKVGAYTERATAEGEWRPGNPGTGQQATPMLSTWFNMLQRELVGIVEHAGIALDEANDAQLLEALQSMGLGTGQFQNYSSLRTYETGEVVRGSDGHMYEFYDRDQDGTVVGIDPTDPLNRPHIWMRWDGNRPGQTIEWRSETLPEGYIVNDGDDYSRTDYRRIFAAWGTTYGAGDGSTTFGSPDDRGEFKRGWDNGRGIDIDRALPNHQSQEIQNHSHNIQITMADDFNPGVFITSSDTSTGVYNKLTEAFGGSETRPRNNAVIWLTKI